jgi:hypothetical protein
VRCSWQFFIAMRQGLNTCAPGQSSPIRDELDRSIAAANAFIVKNSPRTVMLAEIEARVRALNAQADAGYASLAPEARAKGVRDKLGGPGGRALDARRVAPRAGRSSLGSAPARDEPFLSGRLPPPHAHPLQLGVFVDPLVLERARHV